MEMEENPENTGGSTEIGRNKTPAKPPDKTPNKEETIPTRHHHNMMRSTRNAGVFLETEETISTKYHHSLVRSTRSASVFLETDAKTVAVYRHNDSR